MIFTSVNFSRCSLAMQTLLLAEDLDCANMTMLKWEILMFAPRFNPRGLVPTLALAAGDTPAGAEHTPHQCTALHCTALHCTAGDTPAGAEHTPHRPGANTWELTLGSQHLGANTWELTLGS